MSGPSASTNIGSARISNGIVDMGVYEFQDCNGNGVSDAIDIVQGASTDVNGNGIPDECEAGCQVDTDCDDLVACTDDTCVAANTQLPATQLSSVQGTPSSQSVSNRQSEQTSAASSQS